jgi:hypothetical protein
MAASLPSFLHDFTNMNISNSMIMIALQSAVNNLFILLTNLAFSHQSSASRKFEVTFPKYATLQEIFHPLNYAHQ